MNFENMLAVIFDMDGTLLDTQSIFMPAWEYAGNLQGVSGMSKYVSNVFGMNEAGCIKYLEENHPQIKAKEFRLAAREYVVNNLVVKFKEGARETLDFLKQNNIKVALASGTTRPSVEHHLKELDIFDKFDVIVCGNEVENGKPAPDIFILTATELGVKPDACIVFEDSDNGILSAYNAGMKGVGVPDVVAFKPETKKIMFAELKSLTEAIGFLKKHIKNSAL